MSDREQTATPKVLFVDDEENVLKALKRIFLDENIEILTAGSGKAGLQVLDANPDIAVIVSDQRMPEMSGWEFLEQAKTLCPEAVRIVLTGYADVTAAVNAINKGGASRYIAKPWNDADLVLVVKESIDRYRMVEENLRLTARIAEQNEALQKWNSSLEKMVQEQTLDIQNKNKELEKLNTQLNGNLRKSIEVFSNLIEMREKSMSSHSKNVAVLSRQVAMNMKLTSGETNNILVAALLHDIGKIGVSDAVLMKAPDSLSDLELKDYRSHAVRGQVAIDIIEGFHDIGLIVRHHHEHIDGTGFPDGLRMNAIPLGSRIVAIADAYDRLLNSAMPSRDDMKRVLASLDLSLGSRFDQKVFAQFLPIIEARMAALEKEGSRSGAEVEVPPAKLEPGMVRTQDVRSGTVF